MSTLGGIDQLKIIAIEEQPVDVCTGRCSQAKETGFGSLQALVGGNEGPGWIG